MWYFPHCFAFIAVVLKITPTMRQSDMYRVRYLHITAIVHMCLMWPWNLTKKVYRVEPRGKHASVCTWHEKMYRVWINNMMAHIGIGKHLRATFETRNQQGCAQHHGGSLDVWIWRLRSASKVVHMVNSFALWMNKSCFTNKKANKRTFSRSRVLAFGYLPQATATRCRHRALNRHGGRSRWCRNSELASLLGKFTFRFVRSDGGCESAYHWRYIGLRRRENEQRDHVRWSRGHTNDVTSGTYRNRNKSSTIYEATLQYLQLSTMPASYTLYTRRVQSWNTVWTRRAAIFRALMR